jgi:hypothetical protein
MARRTVVNLFLKSAASLREVSEQIASILLGDFEVQERDGLNLGGGNYYLLKRGETEVILVCNDSDHAEVFVPIRADFRYYCYVHRGSEDVLGRMLSSLPISGLSGELADDA